MIVSLNSQNGVCVTCSALMSSAAGHKCSHLLSTTQVDSYRLSAGEVRSIPEAIIVTAIAYVRHTVNAMSM